jgi:penicillin-binding protein 1C
VISAIIRFVMFKNHRKRHHYVRSAILVLISIFLIATGAGVFWVATLKMPDLSSFKNRKIAESTKIYDRTGTVLLYDTGINAKLTVVPLSDISPFIQKAAIAIEDSNFYQNTGIEPKSIIRAIIANLSTGNYSQGASTITQQVVKNSLLTQDKTVTRKIKEWVLAIKLTKIMEKDQILEAYLNESPYGGTIYGVEEASQQFFGKQAKDVSLAQAAYLAAIPQAPTYYSPYGTHREELDNRQKLVLSRMKALEMISEDEYNNAKAEKVQFLSKQAGGIRAPHFVMFVRDYIVQKYGEDVVNNNGLRVTTSLDYNMQQKAEEVIKKFGPSLTSNFNASNTAMVAIDPKTGDILTMVGSRDYFDETIDGNYNVAIAKRQPGSTFKPFVYSALFKKGYTPETILFDVKTEFSTYCTPEGKPINRSDDPKKACYTPGEYDNIFAGPMTVKQALAQSRNIPAVKALYLAGIQESIQTGEDMGITTLTDRNRYGLTLVLGGGEVTLLDLTSAYGVFANDGVKNPTRSILKVEDSKGNILEEATASPSQVLQPEISRQISDILSDNAVRMESLKPIANSVGRQVAIKTGTTNDYRDVWTVGYTPNLVVGAWAGNNDNTPMQHNVAGLIISPLWGAFMSEVAKTFPPENFQTPPPSPHIDNKPVLHGLWQGGISYKIDKISKKLATEYTPQETIEEIASPDVHTILHWINKDDPRGPAPTNPTQDTQYSRWEYGVRNWVQTYKQSHPEFVETPNAIVPTATDDVHTPDKMPKVTIESPITDSVINPQNMILLRLKSTGAYPPQKTEVYLNGKYALTADKDPLNISFVPADIGSLSKTNTISVTLYDSVFNKGQASVNFSVQ